MKVLGFRFCTVSPEAPKLASFLDALGFERHPLEGGGSNAEGAFSGAVFAAGESWLAMWPPSADMQTGMMLQVVVDDADAFAERAREQGLSPVGPTDSQSKRIYFLQAPTGLQMSIQSRLPGQQERSVPAPPPAPVRTKTTSAPAPTQVRAGKISPPPRGNNKGYPVQAAAKAGARPSNSPPGQGRPRSPSGSPLTQGRGWSPAPTAAQARVLAAPPPPPPVVNRRGPR